MHCVWDKDKSLTPTQIYLLDVLIGVCHGTMVKQWSVDKYRNQILKLSYRLKPNAQHVLVSSISELKQLILFYHTFEAFYQIIIDNFTCVFFIKRGDSFHD